jgi:hypothetical protein
MKKIFTLASALVVSVAAAQTGNVGINTTTPTETLDVNGTTRLRDLPLSGATNAISTLPAGTAAPSKNQTYTPTKTLVIDANGVLGSIVGTPMVNNDTTGAEIKKNIYLTTVSDLPAVGNTTTPANTTKCGAIELTFSAPSGGNTYAMIRLAAPAALTLNQGYSQEYGAGTFTYKSTTQSFTAANYNAWQYITTGTTNDEIINGEVNVVHMLFPGATDYYRLTYMKDAINYSVVCEKF